MKTVGQILSEKRRLLNLSLAEVEKETKIRQKYLEAIEADRFTKIAQSVSISGFVRSYAQFLGLPVDNILAIFRRDFEAEKKNRIIPESLSQKQENNFYWTPKATAILFLSLILAAGLFFGIKQYVILSGAPPVEIFSPADGQIFKEKVLVFGKTDRDATVKIDSIPILVSQDGSFKEETILPKGENIILIEATSRQGKKRVINRKVKVE